MTERALTRAEIKDLSSHILALLAGPDVGLTTVGRARWEGAAATLAYVLGNPQRLPFDEPGTILFVEAEPTLDNAVMADGDRAVRVAELEKDLIHQRTTDALTELRRQGRAWKHVPFGWAVLNGTLAPDHSEQATLCRIRELRQTRISCNKITGKLNAERRSTNQGGLWYGASVRVVSRTAEKVGPIR